MSLITEILLTTAIAVSDTPATEVVPIAVSSVTATSMAIAAPAAVATDTAAATSTVTPSSYAQLTSVATGVSTAPGPTLLATITVTERARATDATIAVKLEQVTEAAQAVSVVIADRSYELTSSAGAVSTLPETSTTGTVTLAERVLAREVATPGRLETRTEAAAATSVVLPQRLVVATVTETGTAASSLPVVAGDVDPDLLVSTAAATGTTTQQLTATTTLASVASGDSAVRFKNPAATAWVLNTESTGAVTYDNFDFESLTQTPAKVLAVGPDGLYELTGDTDDGDTIDAHIDTGFTDFGSANTKRVDTMYFGYTSVGGLSLKTEVYGSGHPASSYTLEPRLAPAPRNTRVFPGKGLHGRYWRVTISNVNGAAFEIHDATVDIAVSARRI